MHHLFKQHGSWTTHAPVRVLGFCSYRHDVHLHTHTHTHKRNIRSPGALNIPCTNQAITSMHRPCHHPESHGQVTSSLSKPMPLVQLFSFQIHHLNISEQVFLIFSITLQVYCCITVSMYHCISLYDYTPVWLYHSITDSFYHSITASLYDSITWLMAFFNSKLN